jgi:hypothetical protein
MTLSLILAALVPAAPLQADPGGACRPEIRRFCPGMSGPRRMACLEARRAELSRPCQDFLSRVRAEGEQFKRDCREDSAKLCPGQEGRPLVDCLEKDLPRLVPACAERVRKLKAEHRTLKERIPAACRVDAEELCVQSGVPPEGIRGCLRAETDALSAPCREALSRPVPPPEKP